MSVGRRDAPPSGYLLKLESYPELLKLIGDRGYESDVFKALDHDWALVFYPAGNRKRNGKDYISLYLKMVDPDNRHRYCSVLVNFSFYVFDHKAKQYVSFPDSVGMVRKFEKAGCEWGCDRFLSLSCFRQTANGYIKGDGSCIFGVEIFPIESSGFREIVSTNSPSTYRWRINNFKSEADKYCISSDEFTRGGRKWKLRFYPNGRGAAKNDYLSVFLVLNDINNVPQKRPVYTNFAVQVIDQCESKKHFRKRATHKYESSSPCWGWTKFMPVKNFEKREGYKYCDAVIIEAEFPGISMVKIN